MVFSPLAQNLKLLYLSLLVQEHQEQTPHLNRHHFLNQNHFHAEALQ